MLKDAEFNYFPTVYVVCGYTDMRYGIDSLTAIIEKKYKVNLFVPNTLFLSSVDNQHKSKVSFGKELDSSFFINALKVVTLPDLEQVMNCANFVSINSNG